MRFIAATCDSRRDAAIPRFSCFPQFFRSSKRVESRLTDGLRADYSFVKSDIFHLLTNSLCHHCIVLIPVYLGSAQQFIFPVILQSLSRDSAPDGHFINHFFGLSVIADKRFILQQWQFIETNSWILQWQTVMALDLYHTSTIRLISDIYMPVLWIGNKMNLQRLKPCMSFIYY